MSLKRYLNRISFIDCLIARKSTGNQKNMAVKIGVSVSTLNEYLNEMKEMGFPIKYCHKSQTYYYEKNGRMVSNFFVEQIDKEAAKDITGGIGLLSFYIHDLLH